MSNGKYERYWDELDIDAEFRAILENEYKKMRAADNEFYRYTRSSDNMGDEFIYRLSSSQNSFVEIPEANKEETHILRT